jgi:hypothetical protein
MSAQRSLPSAGAGRSLIAAGLLGVALGAGGMLLAVRAGRAPAYVVRASSPDRARLALSVTRPCPPAGTCGELRIGSSDEDSSVVHTLDGPGCDEVVWTPDGTRVGFVIGRNHLMVFEAASRRHAGTVRLLTEEAAQSRIVRGVTFSANGRAVTFDDCPRDHSGCRAGVVGIPQ